MKIIVLPLLLQTAILITVFTGTLRAEDTDGAVFSQDDLEAKLTYCETCHGLSAQGFRGYSVMPRLAGQQTEYLENQLRAFVEHRRDNKFMLGVASALSPAMVTALVTHFRDLNPKLSRLEMLHGNWSLLERNFTKKEFPVPIFPPVLPITV
jgi:cytochrome c553